MDISNFVEFTHQLADESGALIRQHWDRSGVAVDYKADKTVVTETDRDTETLLRRLINETYPDHGIIGEEFGSENTDADYVWILDPIDGTISYVHRIPLFGTLIGLLHKGKPIVGCIHQPILRELCIGDNNTTTFNGKPAKVRPCNAVSDAVLLATDTRRPAHHNCGPAWETLIQEARLFRTWGDCYGYMKVAIGHADAMFDPILSPWDLLPLVPVIRGAGGVITDWHGNDPSQGKSAIASSPQLHAEYLRRLAPENSR